ncbi:MAG: pilus assembly PilX N-terminal domain-containing protein [Candidatus Zixiibacteriota bacterium]|nr:MAG: pilus assembly PilX N-terminal domain-containing protein [candidate division Zixibacteria bacterium]
MKKLINDNSGGALVIVLGLMLLLTIAAILAVHTAQTDIDLSFNQVDYDHAFYIADAGLKKAFNELNKDNFWSAGYLEMAFEDGAYTVITERDIPVTDSAFDPITDRVTLRSTASYRESQANLRAVVVPELFYPFKYAVYGEDGILMDNNSETDSYNSDDGAYVDSLAGTEGDVASNGTIVLENSALVNGDASSSLTGGVSVCATCGVTEDVSDAAEPFEIPPIPDSVFTYYESNNDNITGVDPVTSMIYPGPDLILAIADTITLTTGVYYFNDITMNSNSVIILDPTDPDVEVKIYIRGTLTLDNNTTINPNNDPTDCLIFSDGQIVTIGNDTEIYAAFYGPDADVDLGNSCDWYGSIIAESVSMVNTGSLHYDEALAPIPITTTGNMLMISWIED